MSEPTTGKVYLVGAGPGDPGLVTVRGKELIQAADKIIYDSLVNEAILKWAHPEAELIFVGKRAGQHSLIQDDINRVLTDLGKQGHNIVRLKGGDPTVFGRIGEEISALNQANIPYEIIPGVTAGIAGPAYAGIPVTQRGLSSSVTFITGHEAIDREGLVNLSLNGTLVFYMGLKHLEAIAAQLIAAGRAADTPAAVIENATRSHQRTVVATLETLAEKCAAEEIKTPSLIVIGEVADLRKDYAWFEDKPLFGTRVCITHALRNADQLADQLLRNGAVVFEFPTVVVEANEHVTPIDDLESYDWILFTSINGVEALIEQLLATGKDLRDLHGIHLFAISQKTVEALAQRGLNVDGVPEKYEPQAVIDQLQEIAGPLTGQRLLLPRADIGQSALPGALEKAGATVTELQAYQMVIPQEAQTRADQLLDWNPDYIVFNSASAVRNFRSILGTRIDQLPTTLTYASIGPIASKAATECGFTIALEPHTHRVPDLVETIIQHARR